MNTQKVNTAASESSETLGSSKGDFLLKVHNILVRAQRCLKQGYSLIEGEPICDGHHHVSLYKDGKLVWFGWTWERDFMADVQKYIREAISG